MVKPIAIHLPQFHPFPENDEWWGTGFTEWTNVTKAKPLFKGHYQPHLPADLGFYDLRLEEARIAQAELAKEYGIYGFCYYHYWFNGKRLLQQPLDAIIASKKPDFPFMLCWANENWSRRWDGQDHEVLIQQEYSTTDDLEHIRFLCEHFFSDSRYIKVDGKPFIIIYRPGLFPDIKKTIGIWRKEAQLSGIGDLHVGFMNHFSYQKDFKEDGFDCQIDFHPNFSDLPAQEFAPFKEKIKKKIGLKDLPYYNNRIYKYSNYIDHVIKNMKVLQGTFPGITPGWDNTARRTRDAFILKDSTPVEYERWLKKIKEVYKNEETFLFINAWNEWAEGNHLEPCQKWGKMYLEATKRVFQND